MPEGNNRSDQIRTKEYDQCCHDWRHRDSMLWRSVAVTLSLTGAAFAVLFKKDMHFNYPIVIAITLLIVTFNILVLIKIVKDHYYQRGSGELLRQLGQAALISELGLHETGEPRCLRRYPPNDNSAVPIPKLYNRLASMSTFKCFFFLQIGLVIFSVVVPI